MDIPLMATLYPSEFEQYRKELERRMIESLGIPKHLLCSHPRKYHRIRAESENIKRMEICEICDGKPLPVRQYAAELLGGVPIEPNREEQQFAQLIADEPGNVVPRLVFADWLDEQGDDRGELIRIEQTLIPYWEGGTRPENFFELVKRRTKIRIELGLMPHDPFPTVQIQESEITSDHFLAEADRNPYLEEVPAQRQLMRMLCEKGIDPSREIHCYRNEMNRSWVFMN